MQCFDLLNRTNASQCNLSVFVIVRLNSVSSKNFSKINIYRTRDLKAQKAVDFLGLAWKCFPKSRRYKTRFPFLFLGYLIPKRVSRLYISYSFFFCLLKITFCIIKVRPYEHFFDVEFMSSLSAS